MMKTIKAVIFIEIFCSFITYSADNTSQNKQPSPSLPDLPVEIQREILNCLTAGRIGNTLWQKNTEDECGVVKHYRCIKEIVPLGGVCKKLRSTAKKAIKEHVTAGSSYIQNLGGADMALSQAKDRSFAYACITFGADINALHGKPNTDDSLFDRRETLLTQAIKQDDLRKVRDFLRWGADPMVANARGHVPIDIAKERNSFNMAAVLKENGGDPDNIYYYYGEHFVNSPFTYNANRAASFVKEKKSSPFLEESVSLEQNQVEQSKPDISTKKRLGNAKSYQKGYTVLACVAGAYVLIGIKKFFDKRKKQKKGKRSRFKKDK